MHVPAPPPGPAAPHAPGARRAPPRRPWRLGPAAAPLAVAVLLGAGCEEPPADDDTAGEGQAGTVAGRVVSSGVPLEGARVRVQAAPDFLLTDAAGRFELALPDDPSGQGFTVTAGLDGYRSRGVQVAGGTADVEIDLPPVPADDPSYAFVGAQEGQPSCASCHAQHVSEWSASQHAHATEDPHVLGEVRLFLAWWQRVDPDAVSEDALFAGPFNPEDTKGDVGMEFVDGGERFRVAGDRTHVDECARCHAVSLAAHGRLDFRPESLSGTDAAAAEGVTCDVCHKARSALAGSEEELVLPGLDALVFHRPGPGEAVTFGALDDVIVPVMEASYAQAHANSTLCAACHSDARVLELERLDDGGMVVGSETRLIWGEDTFREWAFDPDTVRSVHELGVDVAAGAGAFATSDNYAGEPMTCARCHMQDPPPDPDTGEAIDGYEDPGGDPVTIAQADGAVARDPETAFPHRFEGRSARFVRFAVETSAAGRVDGGELVIDVTLENRHTGHAFPSGLPDRNVLVVVEARDDSGGLAQVAGPVLPDWTSGSGIDPERDRAGQPGKAFARRLADAGGASPVFYVRAVAESPPAPEEGAAEADNRLMPGESDTSTYRFAWRGQAATVTVRVLHRLRFKPQQDALMESDPDVPPDLPERSETEGDVVTLVVRG